MNSLHTLTESESGLGHVVEEQRLDVHGLLESLVRHGVQFVLIGGAAAHILDLPVPATIDVDITPLKSRLNLERLANFFEDVHATLFFGDVNGTWFPRRPTENWAQYDTLHLLTQFGLLDIVFTPSGTTRGYEDLVDEAIHADLQSVHVQVISEPQWVFLKQSTGREKDIDHLRRYFNES
jgi:hypothetical protein